MAPAAQIPARTVLIGMICPYVVKLKAASKTVVYGATMAVRASERYQ
jgi:hypothetical protein